MGGAEYVSGKEPCCNICWHGIAGDSLNPDEALEVEDLMECSEDRE